jgi:hypothetical protein
MIDGNGLWVTSSLIICLFPNIVIYTFIYKVKQAYIRGYKKKSTFSLKMMKELLIGKLGYILE